MLVFDENSQANFTSIGFDKYNEISRSYETTSSLKSFLSTFIASTNQLTSTSLVDSYISLNTNLVQFKITNLPFRSHSTNIKIS